MLLEIQTVQAYEQNIGYIFRGIFSDWTHTQPDESVYKGTEKSYLAQHGV